MIAIAKKGVPSIVIIRAFSMRNKPFSLDFIRYWKV